MYYQLNALLTHPARSSAMPRLLTIPISHYCEKARWALERAGVSYHEEPHVQGIHRVYARRAGGEATVPVLVAEDRVVASSREIVAWADARLAPEQRLFAGGGGEGDPERAICDRLDERLGPAGRRLMYVHMLDQRALALRYNNQGVPLWERAAINGAWPLVQRFIARALGIRPGVEAEDERVVFAELDNVAALLAERGPYLSGSHFGAADLTFAAMAASVVFPPVYGVRLPQPPELAPRTAELVERARAHPAGAHALRMFTEHRRERVA
jgi:glutathione S-transferase